MIDLDKLTIKDVRRNLNEGGFSAMELTEEYLSNIRERNGDVHAYLEVFEDALEQAKEADKKIKKGEKGELLGIPFATKDNILIKGRRASSASKILQNYAAPYDATVIRLLKNAGAIFLGRTNMDEFAMGSSTENSAFGVTKNPYDLSRVPGGSSGGSAAAVAMNGALGALGSDTGGSVRQPAAFCGVVGFKPSYGAVSRHGLMAMSSSLDVIGPIAKTVSDAEIIFSAIKGKDSYDSTSIDVKPKEKGKNKLKVGDLTRFIEEIGASGVSKEVLKNYRESLTLLEKNDYEIKEVNYDLSPLKYALATYYIIMPAEVSTNLARFDGVKYGFHKDGENLFEDYCLSRGEGFGKEARRRIILGTYVLSAGYYDTYYGGAMAVRGLIVETFKKIFEEVDIIAMPTTPTPAFRIGEKASNPVEMYLADIFTVTANIGGVPAISVPSGFVNVEGKNLPLGFQLMAPYGKDYLLFTVGKDFLGER